MQKEWTVQDLLKLNPEQFSEERLGEFIFTHEPTGYEFQCKIPSDAEMTHLMGRCRNPDGSINELEFQRELAAYFITGMRASAPEPFRPLATQPSILNRKPMPRATDAMLSALGGVIVFAIGARLQMVNHLSETERVRLRFFGGAGDSPEPAAPPAASPEPTPNLESLADTANSDGPLTVETAAP